MVKRVDPLSDTLHVGVYQHIQIIFFCCSVTKFDHLMKLPCGVDMEKWKGDFFGIKGFSGEMQHDGAVLSDRIKHNGFFAFCSYFPHDVDRLCLQRT